MGIKMIIFEYYAKYILCDTDYMSFGQIHYYADDGEKLDTYNLDDISENDFLKMYKLYKLNNDGVDIEYHYYGNRV